MRCIWVRRHDTTRATTCEHDPSSCSTHLVLGLCCLVGMEPCWRGSSPAGGQSVTRTASTASNSINSERSFRPSVRNTPVPAQLKRRTRTHTVFACWLTGSCKWTQARRSCQTWCCSAATTTAPSDRRSTRSCRRSPSCSTRSSSTSPTPPAATQRPRPTRQQTVRTICRTRLLHVLCVIDPAN